LTAVDAESYRRYAFAGAPKELSMAKGISVNIGLNSVDPAHYSGWDGRLRACEQDARDMQAIAAAKGFDTKLILTKDATAEAVSDAIRGAGEHLQTGDIFFLTYSGHGGQVPDTNSDEPADEEAGPMDETWVLYDRQLVDDELYSFWGALQPGVRVFVLSDSCHSGSVTRDVFDAAVPKLVEKGMIDDDSPRTKDLPPDVQDATLRNNEQLYEQIQRSNPDEDDVDVKATVLLISGCQDSQLSLDGSRNGLFTQQLLNVWDNGRFRGSYRRFWRAIGKKMPPTQTPNFYPVGAANPKFDRQTPLTI
jgi:metacaspase-1